jgi:hypothetical protein
MKNIKKALRLLGFVLIISLASIGLGINAAIMPSFRRYDSAKPKIEMVESNEEESEAKYQEKI